MGTRPKMGRGGWAGHTAHGEAQRQALAQAAYQLIAEKGFEGLRTRDVAERAGVNIATLHYYFATKEDLIRAVVALMRDLFAGRHVDVDTAEFPQQDPLLAFHEDLADVPTQWNTEPQLYVVLIELYLRSLRDPTIRRILGEMEAHWTAYLSHYLAQGVAQGVFRRDLDVPMLATMMRIAVKGMILEIMTYRDAFPESSPFPAARLSREVECWLRHHACPEG